MNTIRSIKKTALPAALASLGKWYDVFAPVRSEGGLAFTLLPSEQEVSSDPVKIMPDITLGSEKTFLPLKTLYLPTVENLFSFRKEAGHNRVTPSPALPRDRVVVGALACDVAALDIIDPIFLDEFPDEAYRERRERTTIIACSCAGEGPKCFCSSFGIDPLRPAGCDVLLTDTDASFLVESFSDKGDRVLEKLGDYLDTSTTTESRTGDQGADSPVHAPGALRPSISRDDVPVDRVPTALDDLWGLDLWQELAFRCIGCGTCTILCPTCHCFDVQDEYKQSEGQRFRVWDSCMFSGFTKMAGGDNPRPTKVERVRQRFLHKISYIYANHGVIACVGCGRCGAHCPAGIGIGEVFTRLAGGTAGSKHSAEKRAPNVTKEEAPDG
jgi:formate hydrogenlyase subunit 6/NADH:ubiquinone oxidoreductase subunit I